MSKNIILSFLRMLEIGDKMKFSICDAYNMRTTINFLIIIAFLVCSEIIYAKEIAFSFDDAPREITPYLPVSVRSNEIIFSLKKAGINQVVFFCNTKNFDEEGKLRVQQYIEAGHLIGNHSHSHFSLDKTSVDDFWMDILAADRQLKLLKNFRPWFRFPYLHEGKTSEIRDSLRKKLKDFGYMNGYVTVDTYDWYVDRKLQEAKLKGKKIHLENLKKAYLKMIVEGVEFFNELAIKALKRSPRHMLLLHENDLNALFIQDLVSELRLKGWNFISPEEAYQDPINNIEPNTLYLGQGRVAALAKEQNVKVPIWSKWEEEESIDKLLQEMKVFE